MKIEGNLIVKCKCGKEHPFDNEEADFDKVSATDYKWNIDFNCGRCGASIVIDYTVHETPAGKTGTQEVKVYNAELKEKYQVS